MDQELRPNEVSNPPTNNGDSYNSFSEETATPAYQGLAPAERNDHLERWRSHVMGVGARQGWWSAETQLKVDAKLAKERARNLGSDLSDEQALEQAKQRLIQAEDSRAEDLKQADEYRKALNDKNWKYPEQALGVALGEAATLNPVKVIRSTGAAMAVVGDWLNGAEFTAQPTLGKNPTTGMGLSGEAKKKVEGLAQLRKEADLRAKALKANAAEPDKLESLSRLLKGEMPGQALAYNKRVFASEDLYWGKSKEEFAKVVNAVPGVSDEEKAHLIGTYDAQRAAKAKFILENWRQFVGPVATPGEIDKVVAVLGSDLSDEQKVDAMKKAFDSGPRRTANAFMRNIFSIGAMTTQQGVFLADAATGGKVSGIHKLGEELSTYRGNLAQDSDLAGQTMGGGGPGFRGLASRSPEAWGNLFGEVGQVGSFAVGGGVLTSGTRALVTQIAKRPLKSAAIFAAENAILKRGEIFKGALSRKQFNQLLNREISIKAQLPKAQVKALGEVESRAAGMASKLEKPTLFAAAGLQSAGPTMYDNYMAFRKQLQDENATRPEAERLTPQQIESSSVGKAMRSAQRALLVTGALTTAIPGGWERMALFGEMPELTQLAIRKEFAKTLVKTGAHEFGSEFTEEALDEFANGFLDALSANPGTTLGQLASNAGYAGAVGGLLGGVTSVYSNAKAKVKDMVSQRMEESVRNHPATRVAAQIAQTAPETAEALQEVAAQQVAEESSATPEKGEPILADLVGSDVTYRDPKTGTETTGTLHDYGDGRWAFVDDATGEEHPEIRGNVSEGLGLLNETASSLGFTEAPGNVRGEAPELEIAPEPGNEEPTLTDKVAKLAADPETNPQVKRVANNALGATDNPNAIFTEIKGALDSTDPAITTEDRKALEQTLVDLGAKPYGNVGEETDFAGAEHKTPEKGAFKDYTRVKVTEPGYKTPDGVVLRKAQVEPIEKPDSSPQPKTPVQEPPSRPALSAASVAQERRARLQESLSPEAVTQALESPGGLRSVWQESTPAKRKALLTAAGKHVGLDTQSKIADLDESTLNSIYSGLTTRVQDGGHRLSPEQVFRYRGKSFAEIQALPKAEKAELRSVLGLPSNAPNDRIKVHLDEELRGLDSPAPETPAPEPAPEPETPAPVAPAPVPRLKDGSTVAEVTADAVRNPEGTHQAEVTRLGAIEAPAERIQASLNYAELLRGGAPEANPQGEAERQLVQQIAEIPGASIVSGYEEGKEIPGSAVKGQFVQKTTINPAKTYRVVLPAIQLVTNDAQPGGAFQADSKPLLFPAVLEEVAAAPVTEGPPVESPPELPVEEADPLFSQVPAAQAMPDSAWVTAMRRSLSAAAREESTADQEEVVTTTDAFAQYVKDTFRLPTLKQAREHVERYLSLLGGRVERVGKDLVVYPEEAGESETDYPTELENGETLQEISNPYNAQAAEDTGDDDYSQGFTFHSPSHPGSSQEDGHLPLPQGTLSQALPNARNLDRLERFLSLAGNLFQDLTDAMIFHRLYGFDQDYSDEVSGRGGVRSFSSLRALLRPGLSWMDLQFRVARMEAELEKKGLLGLAQLAAAVPAEENLLEFQNRLPKGNLSREEVAVVAAMLGVTYRNYAPATTSLGMVARRMGASLATVEHARRKLMVRDNLSGELRQMLLNLGNEVQGLISTVWNRPHIFTGNEVWAMVAIPQDLSPREQLIAIYHLGLDQASPKTRKPKQTLKAVARQFEAAGLPVPTLKEVEKTVASLPKESLPSPKSPKFLEALQRVSKKQFNPDAVSRVANLMASLSRARRRFGNELTFTSTNAFRGLGKPQTSRAAWLIPAHLSGLDLGSLLASSFEATDALGTGVYSSQQNPIVVTTDGVVISGEREWALQMLANPDQTIQVIQAPLTFAEVEKAFGMRWKRAKSKTEQQILDAIDPDSPFDGGPYLGGQAGDTSLFSSLQGIANAATIPAAVLAKKRTVREVVESYARVRGPFQQLAKALLASGHPLSSGFELREDLLDGGQYSSGDNLVSVGQQAPDRVVFHEILHSATVRALLKLDPRLEEMQARFEGAASEEGQSALAREYRALLTSIANGEPSLLQEVVNLYLSAARSVGVENLIGDPSIGENSDLTHYAYSNLFEFVAEATTREVLQNQLQDKGLWEKFVDWVRNLFGLPTSQRPLIDSVLRLTQADAALRSGTSSTLRSPLTQLTVSNIFPSENGKLLINPNKLAQAIRNRRAGLSERVSSAALRSGRTDRLNDAREVAGRDGSADAQAAALREWAQVNGLWIKPQDFNKPWKASGSLGETEHEVYPDPATQSWVKRARYDTFHNSYAEYLDRLAVHRYLFPETAPELIGFTETEDGMLAPVIRQPHIEGTQTTEATALAYLEGKLKMLPAVGQKDKKLKGHFLDLGNGQAAWMEDVADNEGNAVFAKDPQTGENVLLVIDPVLFVVDLKDLQDGATLRSPSQVARLDKSLQPNYGIPVWIFGSLSSQAKSQLARGQKSTSVPGSETQARISGLFGLSETASGLTATREALKQEPLLSETQRRELDSALWTIEGALRGTTPVPPMRLVAAWGHVERAVRALSDPELAPETLEAGLSAGREAIQSLIFQQVTVQPEEQIPQDYFQRSALDATGALTEERAELLASAISTIQDLVAQSQLLNGFRFEFHPEADYLAETSRVKREANTWTNVVRIGPDAGPEHIFATVLSAFSEEATQEAVQSLRQLLAAQLAGKNAQFWYENDQGEMVNVDTNGQMEKAFGPRTTGKTAKAPRSFGIYFQPSPDRDFIRLRLSSTVGVWKLRDSLALSAKEMEQQFSPAVLFDVLGVQLAAFRNDPLRAWEVYGPDLQQTVVRLLGTKAERPAAPAPSVAPVTMPEVPAPTAETPSTILSQPILPPLASLLTDLENRALAFANQMGVETPPARSVLADPAPSLRTLQAVDPANLVLVSSDEVSGSEAHELNLIFGDQNQGLRFSRDWRGMPTDQQLGRILSSRNLRQETKDRIQKSIADFQLLRKLGAMSPLSVDLKDAWTAFHALRENFDLRRGAKVPGSESISEEVVSRFQAAFEQVSSLLSQIEEMEATLNRMEAAAYQQLYQVTQPSSVLDFKLINETGNTLSRIFAACRVHRDRIGDATRILSETINLEMQSPVFDATYGAEKDKAERNRKVKQAWDQLRKDAAKINAKGKTVERLVEIPQEESEQPETNPIAGAVLGAIPTGPSYRLETVLRQTSPEELYDTGFGKKVQAAEKALAATPDTQAKLAKLRQVREDLTVTLAQQMEAFAERVRFQSSRVVSEADTAATSVLETLAQNLRTRAEGDTSNWDNHYLETNGFENSLAAVIGPVSSEAVHLVPQDLVSRLATMETEIRNFDPQAVACVVALQQELSRLVGIGNAIAEIEPLFARYRAELLGDLSSVEAPAPAAGEVFERAQAAFSQLGGRLAQLGLDYRAVEATVSEWLSSIEQLYSAVSATPMGSPVGKLAAKLGGASVQTAFDLDTWRSVRQNVLGSIRNLTRSLSRGTSEVSLEVAHFVHLVNAVNQEISQESQQNVAQWADYYSRSEMSRRAQEQRQLDSQTQVTLQDVLKAPRNAGEVFSVSDLREGDLVTTPLGLATVSYADGATAVIRLTEGRDEMAAVSGPVPGIYSVSRKAGAVNRYVSPDTASASQRNRYVSPSEESYSRRVVQEEEIITNWLLRGDTAIDRISEEFQVSPLVVRRIIRDARSANPAIQQTAVPETKPHPLALANYVTGRDGSPVVVFLNPAQQRLFQEIVMGQDPEADQTWIGTVRNPAKVKLKRALEAAFRNKGADLREVVSRANMLGHTTNQVSEVELRARDLAYVGSLFNRYAARAQSSARGVQSNPAPVAQGLFGLPFLTDNSMATVETGDHFIRMVSESETYPLPKEFVKEQLERLSKGFRALSAAAESAAYTRRATEFAKHLFRQGVLPHEVTEHLGQFGYEMDFSPVFKDQTLKQQHEDARRNPQPVDWNEPSPENLPRLPSSFVPRGPGDAAMVAVDRVIAATKEVLAPLARAAGVNLSMQHGVRVAEFDPVTNTVFIDPWKLARGTEDLTDKELRYRLSELIFKHEMDHVYTVQSLSPEEIRAAAVALPDHEKLRVLHAYYSDLPAEERQARVTAIMDSLRTNRSATRDELTYFLGGEYLRMVKENLIRGATAEELAIDLRDKPKSLVRTVVNYLKRLARRLATRLKLRGNPQLFAAVNRIVAAQRQIEGAAEVMFQDEPAFNPEEYFTQSAPTAKSVAAPTEGALRARALRTLVAGNQKTLEQMLHGEGDTSIHSYDLGKGPYNHTMFKGPSKVPILYQVLGHTGNLDEHLLLGDSTFVTLFTGEKVRATLLSATPSKIVPGGMDYTVAFTEANAGSANFHESLANRMAARVVAELGLTGNTAAEATQFIRGYLGFAEPTFTSEVDFGITRLSQDTFHLINFVRNFNVNDFKVTDLQSPGTAFGSALRNGIGRPEAQTQRVPIWGHAVDLTTGNLRGGSYRAGGYLSAAFRWDPRAYRLLEVARGRAARIGKQLEYWHADLTRALTAHERAGNPVANDTVNRALGNLDNSLRQVDLQRLRRMEADGLARIEQAYRQAEQSVAAHRTMLGAMRNRGPVYDRVYRIYHATMEQARGMRTLALESLERQVQTERVRLLNLRRQEARTLRMQALQALPPDVQRLVQNMRNHIDLLSVELRNSGAVQGNLTAAFDANRGLWLHRSYRIFDQANYVRWLRSNNAEATHLRNNALRWIEREAFRRYVHREVATGTPRSGAIANARTHYSSAQGRRELALQFEEFLSVADGNVGSILQGATAGKKPIEHLLARGSIPRPIRELWGEHANPAVNAAKSLGALATHLANHQFLSDLRELGESEGWISDEPQLGFVPLVGENERNPRFTPLAGRYGPPLLRDALKGGLLAQAEKGPKWFQLAQQLTGYAMLSKTAFYWAGGMRNFMANILPMFSANYLDLRTLASDFSQSAEAVFPAIFDRGNANARARVLRATELGVLGETNAAGLVDELLGPDTERRNYERAAGIERAGWQGAIWWRRFVNPVPELAKRGYASADEVWKLMAFEVELRRRQNIYRGILSPTEIEQRAAETVKRTLPTYSRAPEAIRVIRRVPLIAPFVTFTGSVYQIFFGTMQVAVQDIAEAQELRAQGHAVAANMLQTHGIARLMSFVGGITLAASLPLLARMLLSWRDDEPFDQEDDDYLREHIAPWEKTAGLMPLGRNGQTITYLNTTFSNIYDLMFRPFRALSRAIRNQESVGTTLKSFAGEFLDPFAKEQLFFGSLLDVLRGVDSDGKEVWKQGDTDMEKLVASLAHVWKGAFEPGTVASVRRITQAARGEISKGGKEYTLGNELWAGVLGIKVQDTNIAQSLGYAAQKFQYNARDAASVFTSKFGSEGTVSDSELKDAYVRSNEHFLAAYKDLKRKADGARKLVHMTDSEIAEIMDGNHVGGNQISGILSNKYVRYEPKQAMLSRVKRIDAQRGWNRLGTYYNEVRPLVPEVQPIDPHEADRP